MYTIPMKKELEEKLRYMQSHPTTGTPHNEQVISSQVETIFMLDELKDQIVKLNDNIEKSDKQSQKLEQSNYRLQKAMLVLTAIGVGIAAFPGVLYVFNQISPFVAQIFNKAEIPMAVLTVLSALISIAFSLLTFKYEKKFTETIRIKDTINIVLKDKDGNIKEIR